MDGFRKSDASGALSKKHFARFHERIQNKYMEMQKKLQKSKSVDSIACLNDDFVVEQSKHLSSNDIREEDQIFSKDTNVKKLVKYNVIVEDVNTHEVAFVDCNEPIVYESEVTVPEGKSENSIYFRDDISSSLESLSEELKEDKVIEDVFIFPPISGNITPSPSPKISMRNKIGTRISAAKERRREVKDKKEGKKKESLEGVEKLILTNISKLKKMDNTKKKNKIASVTVALIEATGLENEATAEEKTQTRCFFCRIRLGAEKRKSKTIKTSSNDNAVNWQELFNLGLFDDSFLEITMWDKDTFIGRTLIDLSAVEKEKTHRMILHLEERGNVQIFILLTISGATLVNTFVDLDDYQEFQRRIEVLRQKYSWYALSKDFSDVGWLSIIVYGAKRLPSSDAYCVVELENDRLLTHTEYKTHDPNWMKIMEFSVTDVTKILHITIFDERKSEAIGKLCIPLLWIENGKKKWYALKDSTLRERAKGNNPRLLLEMKLFFNLVKASLRVVNPKEDNYLEIEREFSRHAFGNNVTRAKAVVMWTLDSFKVLKTCFEWESRKSNSIALAIWLLFWWFYKGWMLPLLLLLPFALYRPQKYRLIKKSSEISKEEDSDDKEEKNKSLMRKLNDLQDTIKSVQNWLGKLAVFGESIKNLCNFTMPLLSVFAILLILLVSFVMFLIPVRYILMGWGLHKFLRKIFRPNRISNNEILDLLSRVPDDETLHDCEELPLLELTEEDDIH